jgi:two-component system, chemotaxis family, CheB/CheR fusion protein
LLATFLRKIVRTFPTFYSDFWLTTVIVTEPRFCRSFMEKENRLIKGKHTIIAIEASAAGLKAINSFFDHAGIIKNTSFIIQHLSSDHKGFLIELLSEYTTMPVVEAEDNMLIKKETVYVVPPKMTLKIVDNRLRLAEKNSWQINNTTTDFFLTSLAENQKENAIAIILPGADTDDVKKQIKYKDSTEHKYKPLDQHEYIKDLEAQLIATRDNLQLAIEGLETTNEELQSTNEELQSSNEELLSLNEELHSLNIEHQAKIKELIELNDDLDNYLKSTDIGQIFLDSKLNIRRFNPNARQFINLIETDIGRPISHISNNLEYNMLEDIEAVQATGKMVETEVNLQNGRVVIVRIYPFMRNSKVKDGLVLTFIDVTDVKNLYGVVNGVFNSSLNSIIVLSAEKSVDEGKIVDFKIDTVNYAAEELLGDTKEKLNNQSFKRIAPYLLQHNIWSKLIEVVNTGIPFNLDYYYDTPAGEKSYDLSVVKINDGVMITYADITQKKNAERRLKKNYNELIVTRESLKELNFRLEEEVADRTRELSMSEERFRLVSRATNDVIKDWNLADNKVWNSESFFSLFNFNTDEVTEHIDFWFSHIHPEDIEDVKKGIFNAINTGQPQWVGEYRFENGKGIYGHVLERGYILQNGKGMPYRLISSLMDISALKKAEEATRELLLKKDEFMSIASHELKTPITSMKASLQIVQRIIEEKDSEILALDFIRKANEQVDKLTTLVENLLDVTKIQAGKMAFNKSEFDMSELINECVYHIQNLSRNPILINRNEAVHVFADQNRIEQVIMNFLSNAVKYSPDSTEIILNAYEQEESFKVEIKDKGIGIAEENLPYIFDRFFRGINSSEKFSGLGLGLYISADIIRRHGGKVGVDSNLGHGSTFWFTIPLHSSAKKITHAKP